MDFSNFDTSVLLDNLNRFDKDLMILSNFTGVDSDDLRVRIAEGKRNVCSLIIEGADFEFVQAQLDILRHLGCGPAIEKFIKRGRWT